MSNKTIPLVGWLAMGATATLIVGLAGIGAWNLISSQVAAYEEATEAKRKIAFVSNRDGNGEIYTINADGTELVNLTNHPAQDGLQAWSPDGKKILFTSDRNGKPELFQMKLDGSDVRPLASFGKGGSAEYSPNGKKILFIQHSRVDNQMQSSLAVMNSNASGFQELTLPKDLIPFQADWSPDSEHIAFSAFKQVHGSSARAAIAEIYRMNANGTNLQKLTDSTVEESLDAAPDWSPDGKKIAFVSNRDHYEDSDQSRKAQYKQEIYVMNADGTNQQRLTKDGLRINYLWKNLWSSNGQHIIYNRKVDHIGSWDIYRINADGTGQVRLTHDKSSRVPNWSPKGNRITYCKESFDKAKNEIAFTLYLMDIENSKNTKLVESGCPGLWQPTL